MKKILVFGANGKVGSIVVEKLLAEDFQVIAFIRGNSTFRDDENLTIIQGDIHDKSSVNSAVEQADIVISTLGSWGTKTKDILSTATEHIVPAMEKSGLERIITLTGAEARADEDELGIIHRIMHAFLKISAGKILQDGEKHMHILRKSNLSWTILRSPIMNEKGDRNFTLSMKRCKPWQTIHRDAVAEAIVGQVKNDSFNRKAPFLHR